MSVLGESKDKEQSETLPRLFADHSGGLIARIEQACLKRL